MWKNFKKNINKSLILYLISLGVIFFIFIFLISVNIIGYSVKNKCKIAQQKYNGDCVEALISYLKDEKNDYYSRNSAIWALGQLGDNRSLETLQSYYTEFKGEKCNRSKELSQLELQRAIGYMEDNPNITTFFWRFGNGIN